jgi:hypothetical protein
MMYGALETAGFLLAIWAIAWGVAALFVSAPWWVSILLMILLVVLLSALHLP